MDSTDSEFKSAVFQDAASLKKSSSTAQKTSDADIEFLLSVRNSLFSSPNLEKLSSLVNESYGFRPKNRQLNEDDIQDRRNAGYNIVDFPVSAKTRNELMLTAFCFNVCKAIHDNPSSELFNESEVAASAILRALESRFGPDKIKHAGKVLEEAFCTDQLKRCSHLAGAPQAFNVIGVPEIVSDAKSPTLRMTYFGEEKKIVLDSNDENALQNYYQGSGKKPASREVKLGEAIGPFKPLYPDPKRGGWVVELVKEQTTEKSGWLRKSIVNVKTALLTATQLAGRDLGSYKNQIVEGFTLGVAEKDPHAHKITYGQPDQIITQKREALDTTPSSDKRPRTLHIDRSWEDFEQSSVDIGNGGRHEPVPASPTSTFSDESNITQWSDWSPQRTGSSSSVATTTSSTSLTMEPTINALSEAYQSLYGTNLANAKVWLSKYNDENRERAVFGGEPLTPKEFFQEKFPERPKSPPITSTPAPSAAPEVTNPTRKSGPKV